MADEAAETVDTQGVGVADLLEALRDDIEESRRRLAESGKEAMFDVEDVEVEVAVTITRTTDVRGGVKVTVLGFLGVDAGASHQRGRDAVNRLKLTLKPRKILEGGVAAVRRTGKEGSG
jgi:hypothetical protein